MQVTIITYLWSAVVLTLCIITADGAVTISWPPAPPTTAAAQTAQQTRTDLKQASSRSDEETEVDDGNEELEEEEESDEIEDDSERISDDDEESEELEDESEEQSNDVEEDEEEDGKQEAPRNEVGNVVLGASIQVRGPRQGEQGHHNHPGPPEPLAGLVATPVSFDSRVYDTSPKFSGSYLVGEGTTLAPQQRSVQTPLAEIKYHDSNLNDFDYDFSPYQTTKNQVQKPFEHKASHTPTSTQGYQTRQNTARSPLSNNKQFSFYTTTENPAHRQISTATKEPSSQKGETYESFYIPFSENAGFRENSQHEDFQVNKAAYELDPEQYLALSETKQSQKGAEQESGPHSKGTEEAPAVHTRWPHVAASQVEGKQTTREPQSEDRQNYNLPQAGSYNKPKVEPFYNHQSGIYNKPKIEHFSKHQSGSFNKPTEGSNKKPQTGSHNRPPAETTSNQWRPLNDYSHHHNRPQTESTNYFKPHAETRGPHSEYKRPQTDLPSYYGPPQAEKKLNEWKPFTESPAHHKHPQAKPTSPFKSPPVETKQNERVPQSNFNQHGRQPLSVFQAQQKPGSNFHNRSPQTFPQNYEETKLSPKSLQHKGQEFPIVKNVGHQSQHQRQRAPQIQPFPQSEVYSEKRPNTKDKEAETKLHPQEAEPELSWFDLLDLEDEKYVPLTSPFKDQSTLRSEDTPVMRKKTTKSRQPKYDDTDTQVNKVRPSTEKSSKTPSKSTTKEAPPARLLGQASNLSSRKPQTFDEEDIDEESSHRSHIGQASKQFADFVENEDFYGQIVENIGSVFGDKTENFETEERDETFIPNPILPIDYKSLLINNKNNLERNSNDDGAEKKIKGKYSDNVEEVSYDSDGNYNTPHSKLNTLDQNHFPSPLWFTSTKGSKDSDTKSTLVTKRLAKHPSQVEAAMSDSVAMAAELRDCGKHASGSGCKRI